MINQIVDDTQTTFVWIVTTDVISEIYMLFLLKMSLENTFFF